MLRPARVATLAASAALTLGLTVGGLAYGVAAASAPKAPPSPMAVPMAALCLAPGALARALPVPTLQVRVGGPALRASAYARLRVLVRQGLRQDVKAGKLTTAQAADALKVMEKAWHALPTPALLAQSSRLAARIRGGFAFGPPPALKGLPAPFRARTGVAFGARAAGPAGLVALGCGAGPAPVLKALGTTRAQLEKLTAGGAKTVGQIAEANGVSKATFLARITAGAKAMLHRAVAAGLVSPAQEKKALAQVAATATRLWGARVRASGGRLSVTIRARTGP